MEHYYPLVLADHPDWHGDRNYSPQVREILARALRRLDRSRPRELAFARVYPFIRPFLDAPMSLHQRLRLSYLAARGRAARNEDTAALHWLNKALDLESQLDDTGDLAQLHFLRGGTYRRLLRLNLASHEHRRALRILSSDMTRSGYHDSSFRLDVLSQLVGFEFYLGHYWSAQQYLEDATHLLPFVPNYSTSAAYVTWMRSLLDRWSGLSQRALDEARAAARVIVALGNASSADRITLHAVECALDIAQRLDIQSSTCHRYLTLAREDLATARKLARSDQDQFGLELAALAEVRWSRIARRDEDRFKTLDGILMRARELNYMLLIAQTFTTRGDEFALHEERESANTCYRAALDALEGSDCPAAGVWAWRALHIPREWEA